MSTNVTVLLLHFFLQTKETTHERYRAASVWTSDSEREAAAVHNILLQVNLLCLAAHMKSVLERSHVAKILPYLNLVYFYFARKTPLWLIIEAKSGCCEVLDQQHKIKQTHCLSQPLILNNDIRIQVKN